jgi:hypothetical protein
MNDIDVLTQLRDSLSGVHMDTPLELIVTRGTARRRRRFLGLAAAGVAAAGAVGLVVSGVDGHGNPSAPTGAGTAQLAAFSIADGPNGSSTLTLRKGAQYRLDPEALRQALADHGIPAVVTLGTSCDTDPEPSGLDRVVSSRRLADGSVMTTFTPSALPAGSKLSIGYFPTRTTVALIEDGAPLHCSNNAGQATNSKPVTG